MSSFTTIACYAGAILSAIAVQVALPTPADDLLVIQRAGAPGGLADQRIYQMLDGTDAKLLGKVGSHSFIIRGAGVDGTPGNASLIQTLYNNGAFLVLNAAGLAGCTGANAIKNSRSYLA